MTEIERGLLKMLVRQHCLVYDGSHWVFAVPKHLPDGPDTETPIVTAGGVLRSGFWETPQEALEMIGKVND